MAIVGSLNDEFLFTAALVILYAFIALNILLIQFFPSPYGRHRRSGGGAGATLPPPVAWFLMETPNLFLTPLVYPLGRRRAHPISILAFSLYLLHYFHRTLIYPLRLRNPTQKKTTQQEGFPVSVAFAGFVCNLFNAYLQTRSLSHYVDYPSGEYWKLRALVGVAIFFWGMSVNVRSDVALVKLKKEAGGGYKIPRGGWFQWVCCPNYMGESVEWLGWALVAWSPASLGFSLFTCSNLGPRAREHLRWYREKFGDEFPSSTKAIVPLLY